MTSQFNRRTFLGSTLAIGAAAYVSRAGATATEPRRLVVGERILEVLGRSAQVFGLTDAAGTPGILLGPAERFTVSVENTLRVSTSIHWHGQTPAPELDGIAETGYVEPLAPGEARGFDFAARPGTHWMHSHHGLQEQSLLTAPLIVQSREDTKADVQEVVLLLNDFSFRGPEEIYSELTGGAAMDHGAGGMAGMDHSTMSMSGMDLNDVEYDAFLANDRTLDDPQVVVTERSGRVRLRIINGASSTAFWIDLGRVQASLVAVDGNPVVPLLGSRFPLAQAQRLDLLLDVPSGSVVPVLARREGDVARTGIILAAPGASIGKLSSNADSTEIPIDLSLEAKLSAISPLAVRSADVSHMVMLTGSMSPYAWTLDERSWANRNKLEVRQGQRVELAFMNHSMMAHPMHLHGHHFQVVGINGRRFAGAIRDTVLVPPMATVAVAFEADNPGRWLYHCHNLYHMAAGMMSELVYV